MAHATESVQETASAGVQESRSPEWVSPVGATGASAMLGIQWHGHRIRGEGVVQNVSLDVHQNSRQHARLHHVAFKVWF